MTSHARSPLSPDVIAEANAAAAATLARPASASFESNAPLNATRCFMESSELEETWSERSNPSCLLRTQFDCYRGG
ncbi:unnamed protein product [Peronospora effusa]|nr:unnamed protein product [Peronospora effusa]